MSLPAPQPAQQPLLAAAPEPRDWLELAWQRLHRMRALHPDWTLAIALRQPGPGRVLRLFAAQLERDAQILAEHAARAARYGTAVRHNGFGYAPVPAPTSLSKRRA